MNKIITSKMDNNSMPDVKFTIQNEQNNFSIYYLDNKIYTGLHLLHKKNIIYNQ